MKKVLIFSDYYLPGFKSGALRTVVNMVERLGDRFEFYVITRNHDGGDPRPYTTINAHAWNRVGNAQVYYEEPQKITGKLIKKLVAEVQPDAVYLNSCFARMALRFLLLRRLGRIPAIPVVLAPEAELMLPNLQLKGPKKKLFFGVAFPLGLYRNLIWKASSDFEVEDVKRKAGTDCEVFLAPNMPPKTILDEYQFVDKPEKVPGKVRLVFISRIMDKKNITFALKMLMHARGEVMFDIYGPIEDPAYWAECEALIKLLPPNVRATYCGEVVHEKVAPTLSKYHFFLMPTIGENFGHIIIETFAAGSPALISDRTPWRNLTAQKIGWDISLYDQDAWVTAIQRAIDMGADEFADWAAATRAYAVEWLASPDLETTNFAVLQRAVNGAKPAVAGSELAVEQ